MNRIIVLDGVKAAAILLIIFIHLYNYLMHHPFTGHHDLIALLSFLALAGFTFVSGYTTLRKQHCHQNAGRHHPVLQETCAPDLPALPRRAGNVLHLLPGPSALPLAGSLPHRGG